MGKYSPLGLFYLHLTIISFGLLIIIALKNFDFTDFRNSPTLTINQITFIYLLLIIGVMGIIAFLFQGYFVKTPKYYTRAGIAVIFIMIGFVFIIGMILHDRLLGREQNIAELETLGIIFGSVLTIIGSFAYISLKFPDEQIIKHFKEAVQDEIKRAREEERRLLTEAYHAKKRTIKAIKPMEAIEVHELPEPGANVQEVQMIPAEDITVVKCSKCQRSLKLTSSERPLTIKCPHCDAIGVIKE